MPWDPVVYTSFQKERYKPFEDLIQLVNVRPNLKVVDLGCGTGELTRRLQEMLPQSSVTGVDSSPEMLERAKQFETDNVRFELKAIESVHGEWDLIFSHAALHWVADHRALLRRLYSMVRDQGQLVVQVPSNYNHPVMKSIPEIAAEEPFLSALNGWRQPVNVLKPQEYAELLYGMGGMNLTIYEKIYPHILKDSNALADWTSGTALVPYMERLTDELKEAFMKRYRDRLRNLYPESPVFFGFSRILFSADK